MLVSRSRAADLALVLNTVIWGTTFVVVKQALNDCSVLLFLALRFSIAGIALAVVFGRGLEFSRRGVAGGILAGLFLIGGYILQTAGLLWTTASKSGFLTGLNVVLVPLLSAIVYRSVPGWREWTGALLALAGMALMTLENLQFAMNRGDSLTVACAVAFAFHPLVIARFAGSGTKVISLVQIATGAILAWALVPLLEQPFVRWTPQLIGALAVTGLLATALVFTLQTWAQQYTTPTRVALIFAMEPVIAAATGVAVAGDRLAVHAWLGAALILAAILLVELKPLAEAGHPK
jgi:drug/metabolite transporter (DMT)-like permease